MWRLVTWGGCPVNFLTHTFASYSWRWRGQTTALGSGRSRSWGRWRAKRSVSQSKSLRWICSRRTVNQRPSGSSECLPHRYVIIWRPPYHYRIQLNTVTANTIIDTNSEVIFILHDLITHCKLDEYNEIHLYRRKIAHPWHFVICVFHCSE